MEQEEGEDDRLLVVFVFAFVLTLTFENQLSDFHVLVF